MLKIGSHFAWVGGSMSLSPKNLDRAIRIEKSELVRGEKRLALWHRNPGHSSFAHDTQYHGTAIIDHLLNAHVLYARRQLEELEALGDGRQMLMNVLV